MAYSYKITSKYCYKNHKMGLNIFKKKPFTQASVVFSTGVILRLILTLMFFSYYGWHSVNHIETWLYVGVAQGSHLPAYGMNDPTVWILRGFGMLFSSENQLYGIVLASTLLSSLTAVFIYLLAREMYGDKVGFAAGMIFTSMIEPLALSLIGFTHDHVQHLFIIATMLLAVKAVKAKWSMRIVYAIVYSVLVYFATFINEGIFVGLGITAAYLTYEIFQRLFEKKFSKKTWRWVYPVYITLVIVSSLFASQTIVKDALVDKLEALPQGRFGSADVIPISPSNFWLRNNIQFFLLPFALLIAVRRKDTLAITLTFVGFSLSFIMDRGTRISDLGICILSAHVITGWAETEKLIFTRKLKKRLKKFRLDKLSTLFMIVVFLGSYYAFRVTMTRDSFQYTFVLAALGIIFSSYKLKKEKMIYGMISMLVVSGFLVNAFYVYNADAKRVGHEAEYRLYKWLGDETDHALVLTRWDRGYMLEVISGLKSVSSPNIIQKNIHDALWMPEKSAAITLLKNRVRYIVISSLNFNVAKQEGQLAYALSGGLVLTPDEIPQMELTEHISVYKLRHNQVNPNFFRLLKKEVDEATGVEVMLYEVSYQFEEEFRKGTIVSALAQNLGKSRDVLLNISITKDSNTESYLVNRSFTEEDVHEVVYNLPKTYKGEYDCSMETLPLDDEVWGFKGAIVFKNLGQSKEYDVNLILIDMTASKLAGKMVAEAVDSHKIFFNEGEKKILDFAFRRKYPYHEYTIANNVNEELTVFKNESVNPVNNGVEVFYVNC